MNWNEVDKVLQKVRFDDAGEDENRPKTPKEIKKALECCNEEGRCHECPYDPTGDHNCNCQKNDDALAYIQQLEAERDAAVKDLGVTRDCKVCKHFGHKAYEEPCDSCGIRQPHWEWRGVQKED